MALMEHLLTLELFSQWEVGEKSKRRKKKTQERETDTTIELGGLPFRKWRNETFFCFTKFLFYSLHPSLKEEDKKKKLLLLFFVFCFLKKEARSCLFNASVKILRRGGPFENKKLHRIGLEILLSFFSFFHLVPKVLPFLYKRNNNN